MVSIRRRRLLGLCSGQSSFLAPLPRFLDNGHIPENLTLNSRRLSVHPMRSIEFDQSKEVNMDFMDSRLIIGHFCLFTYASDMKAIPKVHPGLSTASTSSSSKEQHHEQFADVPMSSKKISRCTKKAGMKTTKLSTHSTHKRHEVAVPEVKRRKRHRRKHFENQELCVMRGVYFKNMKWQAAIKVDKKQIHLGTVGSQEEAARLYDRAAFMCGREPNFELSEEEKQELRKFKWEEFLVVTRSAISSKKHQRRSGSLRRKVEPSQNSDWEADHGGGFSGSED